MADAEGGCVPVNHRRRLHILATVLQVIGAVVPFGIEVTLQLELSPPSALRKFLLMVVPWTSLLTVIAVCEKEYEKRVVEKEEGRGSVVTYLPPGIKWLCLVAALLHLAFSFIFWLRTINGWKFGGTFSQVATSFSGLLLIVSVMDLCQKACCSCT